MKGFSKTQNQRRYTLHRILRKKGFKINTLDRTIFIPIEESEVQEPGILELSKKFGYLVQTTILGGGNYYNVL